MLRSQLIINKLFMKKIQALLLCVFAVVWCSCSKSDVKPVNSSPAVTLHAGTNALSGVTSYTKSAVISYTNASNITISGKLIAGGTVPSISLYTCHDITITQNSLGNSTDVGIYLYHCYNITIEYNYITNVSTGVYVDHSTGGNTVVNYNQFLNMNGPFPRGQFVQFNTVIGAGNEINFNKGMNVLGKSTPQEAFNVYMSTGTSTSPIEIYNNWVIGGGPSSSGGGIQLGDTGGSYETASSNILVNPGQMGLSISGGDHMTLAYNKVYAADQSFSNVGVIVWGQSGATVTSPTVVKDNLINFTSSKNQLNPYFLGAGQATPTSWSTNTWNDAAITAAMLPANILTANAATVPIPMP